MKCGWLLQVCVRQECQDIDSMTSPFVVVKLTVTGFPPAMYDANGKDIVRQAFVVAPGVEPEQVVFDAEVRRALVNCVGCCWFAHTLTVHNPCLVHGARAHDRSPSLSRRALRSRKALC